MATKISKEDSKDIFDKTILALALKKEFYLRQREWGVILIVGSNLMLGDDKIIDEETDYKWE